MSSFFFHVKIDLIRPTSRIGNHLRQDINLFNSGTTSIQQSTGNAYVCPRPREPLVDKQSGVSLSNAASINQARDLDQDWRLGTIHYESINMLSPSSDGSVKDAGSPSGSIRTGLSSIYPGLATKARFEPSGKTEEQLGYGIVRLFRDTGETPGLYDLLSSTKSSKHVKKGGAKKNGINVGQIQDQEIAFRNEDCTTLCILTVPTWWDVARLIAFLGDDARDNVSHFRMIRTETAGRYMLLMKFRDGKRAREWRKEWNGKVFDPAAPASVEFLGGLVILLTVIPD